MRFDINILWIDDTPNWQKVQQELFELDIEDYGLLNKIEYTENVDSIIDRLSNESGGFKIYDMIFVDYNISNTLSGLQVIDKLRNESIDADVLFYSANAANDIKKIIVENNGTFEGIYIANRDNFQDKALSLYRKNIRNLLSLSNIRGFLADKTSENDYVVNSYILRKFDELSAEAQNHIRSLVQTNVDKEKKNHISKMNDYDRIIVQDKININQLIGLPSYILTLKAKYLIFDAILKEQQNKIFDEYSIDEYLDKIVKNRNTVAHKKLDVCKQQKYIKHYDNINQFEHYKCPQNCDKHTDDKKISLEDWLEIIKLANVYSELFDKVLSELTDKELATLS